MKVLFLSNLYPNAKEPFKALFNKQKVEHLSHRCQVVVVAPIFWFPGLSIFKKSLRNIPYRETIASIEVWHPKSFYVPKLFRLFYGLFYYWCVRKLIKQLDFDIIYASWVYPDGFAAMKIAQRTKKPYVVEALGSDINISAKTYFRRVLIKKTMFNARYVIAPSYNLKNRIVSLGIPEDKVKVIYVGVDHHLFSRIDKTIARNKLGLGLNQRIVLFVGNLVKIKGIVYLLNAREYSEDKDWEILIIGTGPLENHLRRYVRQSNIDSKVHFLGGCAHSDISLWMNSADLFVLPSLGEGLPNVVLEAISCGLPVVASDVGGVPEIIRDDDIGILIKSKDSRALAMAIDKALAKHWNQNYISQQTHIFSWEKNTNQLLNCLSPDPRISS